MRMSTKGRYGLRVMIELARQERHGPVPVETIAEQQGISAGYIHVLLGGLKAAGLVRTVRGPGGGLVLARPSGEISALDIVTALESPVTPVECVDDSTCCDRSRRCAAREVWCEVAEAIDGALRGLRLDDLAGREVRMQDEPLMYHI